MPVNWWENSMEASVTNFGVLSRKLDNQKAQIIPTALRRQKGRKEWKAGSRMQKDNHRLERLDRVYKLIALAVLYQAVKY